jgi:long-chain acyl-CoA synthetase
MSEARPYPWERSYPPGARWDTPIQQGTVTGLLERSEKKFGDLVAIDYRDRTVTYRELGALSRRAAAGFQKLGIGAGDTVALYLPNTLYHPIAFFGALWAGARITHLSPLDAERWLVHKVTDSGARTIVTANFPGLLAQARKLLVAGYVDRIIVGDEAAWGALGFTPDPIPESKEIFSFARLLEADAAGVTFPALTAKSIALIQYTGGTTGLPKGAMLSHGNLTSMVSMHDAWQSPQRTIVSGERVMCVLPLFHIYGLGVVLLRGLDTGAYLLLRSRFEAEAIVRDIEEKRVAIFPGVPTMWIALANFPGIDKRDLSSLKVCGSGGAPLAVEVAQRFRRLSGLTMHVGWGMTETSPSGCSQPLVGAKEGAIGLPMPGIVMDVAAIDDPRRVLKAGEIGEIRIKGPNVFQGYWNNPGETDKAFVDGFFLTGDVGYMDEDGFFFLVDRKKDMIISGGFNVYPGIIESAVYEHPDVEEVIVIGIPDEYRGEAAKAFVKLRVGRPVLTLESLQKFLIDKLGKHEMPAQLEIRATLPRTPVGKLSKKELIEEEKQKRAKSAMSEAVNA